MHAKIKSKNYICEILTQTGWCKLPGQLMLLVVDTLLLFFGTINHVINCLRIVTVPWSLFPGVKYNVLFSLTHDFKVSTFPTFNFYRNFVTVASL